MLSINFNIVTLFIIIFIFIILIIFCFYLNICNNKLKKKINILTIILGETKKTFLNLFIEEFKINKIYPDLKDLEKELNNCRDIATKIRLRHRIDLLNLFLFKLDNLMSYLIQIGKLQTIQLQNDEYYESEFENDENKDRKKLVEKLTINSNLLEVVQIIEKEIIYTIIHFYSDVLVSQILEEKNKKN